MHEYLNLFPSDASLEAVDQWRAQLHTFQSRLGTYFSLSEAALAAFEYIQTLLCPVIRDRLKPWEISQ